MKKSIRNRLNGFMALLVVIVVLLVGLMNSVFLERFYVFSKNKTLIQSYWTINKLYNTNSEALELELEKLQMNRGMQLVIFDEAMDAVYFTWQDTLRVGSRQFLIPGVPGLSEFMARYEQGAGYEIRRNYDDRLKSEYIDLLGHLDNGYYVLLRTPLQSITESVSIANRFLLWTGLGSILLAVLISSLFSKQIAQPIKELNQIAKAMAGLDFSKKYEVKVEDEIGSLGVSINTLSGKLQQTIEELRQKNIQLENDYQYISKVDEKRKEFLSSVSHELKTPIALIQGYAEALQEKVVQKEEDKEYYYHVIMDEADRMNVLVRKLMALNNLEAGHDELILDQFDLVATVKSVLKRGQLLAADPQLDFDLEGPPEAWVYADEFLIEEVIFNYLTNAIHYVDNGKTIRLTVRAEDGKVRVSVFNTGPRLSEEELERVWESFYKADKSRSREYGGSGLGLTVVKAIMERHQAACGVQNREQGVEFWFELPQIEKPESSQ